MKRCFFWMSLLTMGMWMLAGCSPREPDERSAPVTEPALAAKAAEFVIPSLSDDSAELRLSDYTGKIVLLDFWATWCPPCRAEIPDLNRLYAEWKDKGFELIGMTVDQGAPEKIKQAVKGLNLAYPAGLAGDDIQQHFGGIRAVPTKYLLDGQGRIRKKYVGVVSEKQLVEDLSALMQENTP